jgi:hypothetical protein
MYRFTNGVVVYDKETRDKYIKAGMTLIKEDKPEKEEKDVIKEAQSEIKRSEFRPTRKRTEKFSKNFR